MKTLTKAQEAIHLGQEIHRDERDKLICEVQGIEWLPDQEDALLYKRARLSALLDDEDVLDEYDHERMVASDKHWDLDD